MVFILWDFLLLWNSWCMIQQHLNWVLFFIWVSAANLMNKYVSLLHLFQFCLQIKDFSKLIYTDNLGIRWFLHSLGFRFWLILFIFLINSFICCSSDLFVGRNSFIHLLHIYILFDCRNTQLNFHSIFLNFFQIHRIPLWFFFLEFSHTHK